MKRRPKNVAVVAMANKDWHARSGALLAHETCVSIWVRESVPRRAEITVN